MTDYALPVEILAINQDRVAASPAVEVGEPSVALAITNVRRVDAGVRLTLHLALGFEAEFFHAFKHIDRAVVVTIEEPDRRRQAALRLIDESIQYLEPTWPNFSGYDWGAAPSIVFSGLTRNVELEIAASPGPDHEGLWVQASVLCHRSNRVHVALEGSR